MYPGEETENSKKALDVLEVVSKIQPKYSRTWLFMGAFTNVLAAGEENLGDRNKLLEKAKNYINKAKELSPNRPEVAVELEKNYLIEQNYKAMETTAQNCLKIDPLAPECYWYLGIAEIFLGKQENTLTNISLQPVSAFLCSGCVIVEMLFAFGIPAK